MKEIGGYIEFEHYRGEMLHENAVALNCGRNCLAYLIKSRGIRKLKAPYFLCDSVLNVCEREGVGKTFYHIDQNFRPVDLTLQADEWLYLVNLYGQLSNEEIGRYVQRYGRVVVDQANDYFAEPLPGVDTLYTCRKWFGVADGAFLYTDAPLPDDFPVDESFDRMRFLLGRFERSASEFYGEYDANNKLFAHEPIKRMSALTRNLLRGIDYGAVRQTRLKNFEYLQKELGRLNRLKPRTASFMYPLMVEHGAVVRKRLQAEKIYIPTLWPAVFAVAAPDSLEYRMAENILPLPIDQRYRIEEMEYLVWEVQKCID